MWIAAGGVIVILAMLYGIWRAGKSSGKTEQKKEDAENQAEDMAHDAEIGARPPVDAPFSGMRPKD